MTSQRKSIRRYRSSLGTWRWKHLQQRPPAMKDSPLHTGT